MVRRLSLPTGSARGPVAWPLGLVACLLVMAGVGTLLHPKTSGVAAGRGVDIVRMVPQKAPAGPQSPGREVAVHVRIGSLPSAADKGWLGVMIQALELPLALSLGRQGAEGALITQPTPEGPAARAGIRSGDVLIRYGDGRIKSPGDLRRRVMTTAPQTDMPVTLWRAAPEGSDFVQLLRGLAEAGNAYSMYFLGNMYEYGNGVSKDADQALNWYRRGVDAGSGSAMAALGTALIDGSILAKDTNEGLRLLQLGAERDNPEAMRQLALHMSGGDIIAKNESEAERLLNKAAGAGHTPSMVDLGDLYNRRKTDADWHKAAMWYARATDRDSAAAMVKLGALLENGNGAPQDHAAAVALYQRAANEGDASGMYAWARMLDDGKGVPQQREPDTAAGLILQAIRLGYQFAYQEMAQNSRGWTAEFRRALQSRLQGAGFYSGPIDGDLGRGTVGALDAYRNGR
jgi:TPR repeat protein